METPHLLKMEPGNNGSPLPAIRIFGVGRAGGGIVNGLESPEFDPAALGVVDTDASALADSRASVKIHLENKLLRGLGSGGDPERSRVLAEEHFATLKAACAGARVVLLVGGLGGGAASGILPVLARAAKESGALALAFVLLPFDCEGNQRAQLAVAALKSIRESADGVVCLPSQKIFKLTDENTPVLEIFEATSRFLREGVRGVWQMIAQPGVMPVRIEDLCALLSCSHAECAFAFAEASGPARSRDLAEKILLHPMLEEGRALDDAGWVLVSLKAGRDLTMAEVNRVVDEIKKRSKSAQKMIVGTAMDTACKGQLCLTVIASRDGRDGLRDAASAVKVENAQTPVTLEPRQAAEPILTSLKGRGNKSRQVQGQLPLNIIAKSRFDKSEPTLYQGEDLDVPTYFRRGAPLN